MRACRGGDSAGNAYGSRKATVGWTRAAAIASARLDARSSRSVFVYQAALFAAAALIGVTGHLGGTLVWGVDFLRP